MAEKKRQHFVPKFLLRRFTAKSGRWEGHMFRLPIGGGAPRPAVPRTEAAKNRYYDLPEEVAGTFQPEALLEKIESNAAIAIQRLERSERVRDLDAVSLAYFAALQTNRTPQDRAEARHLDEVMASELGQLRLSAHEQALAFIRQNNPTMTEEQAELERQRLFDDLSSGKIRFESTSEREIGHMFLGLNEAVEQLLDEVDFTLVQFAAPQLVLPDTGYTRYDAFPRVPGGGSGFLDTPTVETVIPVSPIAALLMMQGGGKVEVAKGSAAYAEDLNVRAYAQSQLCIYGQSQQTVVAVRQLVKRRPADVAARRRRPRTLWILEHQDGDPKTGPIRGTGYSIEGTRAEWFEVDPRAFDGQTPVRPEDMW